MTLKHGIIFLLMAPLIGCGDDEEPPTIPPPPDVRVAVENYVTGASDFVLKAESGVRPGTVVCSRVVPRSGPEGRRVDVYLSLQSWSDAGTFDAFGVEVVFDPSDIRFEEASFLDFPSDRDWYKAAKFLDEGPGDTVRVGGASLTNVTPELGSFCVLTFTAVDGGRHHASIRAVTDDFSMSPVGVECQN